MPLAALEASDVDHVSPADTLGGLLAPVTGGVLAVYDRLRWHPEGQVYRLFDPEAAKQWDYGRGFMRPQSFDALRLALALDPQLHVLVGHGLFDLVTPFDSTQVLINQIPPGAGGDRTTAEVRLELGERIDPGSGDGARGAADGRRPAC